MYDIEECVSDVRRDVQILKSLSIHDQDRFGTYLYSIKIDLQEVEGFLASPSARDIVKDFSALNDLVRELCRVFHDDDIWHAAYEYSFLLSSMLEELRDVLSVKY